MTALILSLLACSNFRRHQDPDSPDDSQTESLAVDMVVPEYATTLGGEVEIFGGPFDGSAQVFLDGQPATVLSVTQDSLLIQVPALSTGWADVEVQTDLAQGGKEQALRIFQDATGLAATMGAVEWYELQGSYWTEQSGDFGNAWWGLIEPEDLHWWQLFGVEMEQCVSDPSFPGLRVMDTGAQQTTLKSPSSEVTLAVASDRIFQATLRSADYVDWADYEVPLVSGSELPEFSIERLAATPGSFDLYSPNLYGQAPEKLRKNELDFEWGDVDAERVIVMAERRDADDPDQVLETVACVARNDGSFSIPGSVWQEWEQDEWLYLYVGAVREDGGGIPLNNGESRVAGVYWLLGAATSSK